MALIRKRHGGGDAEILHRDERYRPQHELAEALSTGAESARGCPRQAPVAFRPAAVGGLYVDGFRKTASTTITIAPSSARQQRAATRRARTRIRVDRGPPRSRGSRRCRGAERVTECAPVDARIEDENRRVGTRCCRCRHHLPQPPSSQSCATRRERRARRAQDHRRTARAARHSGPREARQRLADAADDVVRATLPPVRRTRRARP